MKTVIRRSTLTLAAIAMLAGCAAQRTIYYNDGKLAHVVTCTEHAWYSCLQDAGKACQNAGYKVMEKHTGRTSVSLFSSGELVHDLVIECKADKTDAESEPAVSAAPAKAAVAAAAPAKPAATVKPATGETKPVPAAADSPWHM